MTLADDYLKKMKDTINAMRDDDDEDAKEVEDAGHAARTASKRPAKLRAGGSVAAGKMKSLKVNTVSTVSTGQSIIDSSNKVMSSIICVVRCMIRPRLSAQAADARNASGGRKKAAPFPAVATLQGLTFTDQQFEGTGRWSGTVKSDNGERSTLSFKGYAHTKSYPSTRMAKLCTVNLKRIDSKDIECAPAHDVPSSNEHAEDGPAEVGEPAVGADALPPADADDDKSGAASSAVLSRKKDDLIIVSITADDDDAAAAATGPNGDDDEDVAAPAADDNDA
jgi:hypothetical protein